MGFFNGGRGGSGSGGGTANVSDSLINGEILVNGEVVQVYNDAEVKNDVTDLKNNKHSHSNKTQLDRLGINGSNKLTIDGSEIGIGSTVIDSATNGNIVVNGVELTVYNDSSLASSLSAKASINDTTLSASTTFSSNKIDTLLTGKANSTHNHVLADITDVDLTNKINGYALQYNSSTGKFESKALPTGGSGATSMSGLSDVDVTTSPPTDNQVLIYDSVTGKWVPETVIGVSSSPTNIYIIELSRWGISNDGTNAIATTQGINNALVWAYNNNYNYVKFPAGTYLVGAGTGQQDYSTSSCIQPQSNTVYDLYGCTILKETNQWGWYNIVRIDKKENVTIVGGTIAGDKDTHDYSLPASDIHEGAIGIQVLGVSKNITFQNVEVVDVPGYSVDFRGHFQQMKVTTISDYETGTVYTRKYISGTTPDPQYGTLVANSNYLRLKNYIQLSTYQSYFDENGGYFCIWGNGYGSYGTRIDGYPINLSTTIFEIHCFDSAATPNYLGMVPKRGFDPIYVDSLPLGTTQFKISFRYDINQMIQSTFTLQLNANNFPIGIRMDGCKIHDSFSLGVAITGAQQIIIENCEIYNIGWATPVAGKRLYPFPMAIDVEDGSNINQHIIVRNNIFRDLESQVLSAVHTRNLLIENNKMYGGDAGGVVFQGSRSSNVISRQNVYNCAVGTGQGNTKVLFHYDQFIGKQILFQYDSLYENCTFEDMTFQIDMYTHDTFVAGNKYGIGSRVYPTTKNGFYYVCRSGNAEPVIVSSEPTWVATEGSTVTDVAGNVWTAVPDNPIYDKVTFRNCNIKFDRPGETNPAYLLRKGFMEFEGCKMYIDSANFFNDSSTGYDHLGKNKVTFRNCELEIISNIGGLNPDKLYFIGTKFIGKKDKFHAPTFRANELSVIDCDFDNFDMIFQGKNNTVFKNAYFKNNKIQINKTLRKFGATCEGLYVSNFENVFIEGNKVYLPNSSIYARPFTIRVEKFIKVTDNFFESANATNQVEIFGALRDATYNTAAPSTVAVLDENYVKQLTFNQDSAFTSQLSQTVIGTPTTSIG